MASKLGTLTLDLICRTGNFTQGMRDASNSANRELGRIEQSTNGATNAIKGMAVAALGAFSIHQFIAYTDSYTNLQNRLKLVTNSQQELNTATKDTFAIAQATAQSWGSVAQVYQRFAENSSRLGITMQQTASLTDTVSKAISISGASASSAEAALMQFGQALASGVLRGEEFNSIAEQAPALLKAIATGLGVNIGGLRKMAGEGQLTGDIVIKALTKAKTSVDDLFSKTDFTIAQSFTQLNDSVTKFVGEAGQGSGAAKTLASSIKLVADNVDTIADAATVGGIAFLTKTVLSQTIAMKESIAVSIQRRLSDTAALESQIRLSMVEAQRTRAKVGELAAEQNLIVAKLRTNITTQEKIILETRATQVAIQLAVAERNMAAATAQRTVAQNTLNASTAIGSRVLGIVGGPIGLLTIGVTALAAGYMYMQNQTAKATQKLAEQTDVANKTKEELLALQGVQKNGAKSELQEAFKGQNKELKELNYLFNAHLIELENAYKGNLQIVEISNKVRQGIMSQEKAIESLNQLDFISPNQLKQLQKDNELYREKLPVVNKVQEALKVFGVTTELAGNKSSNAAFMHDKQASSLDGVANSATNAKTKLQDYINSLNDQNYSNSLTIGYLNQGYSAEQAQALSKAWSEAFLTSSIVTKEQQELILKSVDLEKQKSDLISERSKKEKENTKELEKQQNVLRLSSQILFNASKYNFGAIEEKNSLPTGTLSAIHAIETGNTGLTNQVNKSTGATGGFQFLAGTAKQYGVNDRKDLGQSAEGAGKYMGYLLKLFKGDLEKAVRAYHAGEGNVQKGTNIGKYNNDYWTKFRGFVAGKSGFSGSSKDFTDSLKTQTEYLQKTIQEIDQLRERYSDADVVRNQKRIDEISEAERLGQTQLVPKINERYSNEIRLAELQLEEQLKGWNWTEDQKLKHQAEVNKIQIALSTELNNIQKQLAKESIDDQLAYELQQYRKTQLQKQFDQINSYKSIQSQIKGISGGADDIFAKATMSPKDYGNWSLKNNRDNSKKGMRDDLTSVEQNIMTSDVYQTDDDRYQALLDAHKEYREGMAALDVQYDQQVKDLAQSQYDAQMSIWQDLLSRTGTIFNDMAEMVKNTAGESSAAYKVMFLTNQGISIAQAMINTEVAATKAMAEGGMVAGIPMATAIRALGYASVGMIAAQTITGMAHNGIDNIPKEGTWLLDGGERVLNPQQNKDLTNYLSNKGSSGGNVEVNVQVTDSGVTSQSNQADQKQLGQMIGNAVRAVIMQEKRQGGLLY